MCEDSGSVPKPPLPLASEAIPTASDRGTYRVWILAGHHFSYMESAFIIDGKKNFHRCQLSPNFGRSPNWELCPHVPKGVLICYNIVSHFALWFHGCTEL